MTDDPKAEPGQVRYQPTHWAKGDRCLVVRRWLQKDGVTELFPTYTVIMTSSNRLSYAEVLQRHWQKQGFENGFKGPLRKMNLHHPLSASLASNRMYYLCGLIAQMLRTYLQYAMLPTAAQDVGLRPLIRDLMRSVAKLTRTGGRYRLLFSKDHGCFAWLVSAMHRYEEWWVSAPGRSRRVRPSDGPFTHRAWFREKALRPDHPQRAAHWVSRTPFAQKSVANTGRSAEYTIARH